MEKSSRSDPIDVDRVEQSSRADSVWQALAEVRVVRIESGWVVEHRWPGGWTTRAEGESLPEVWADSAESAFLFCSLCVSARAGGGSLQPALPACATCAVKTGLALTPLMVAQSHRHLARANLSECCERIADGEVLAVQPDGQVVALPMLERTEEDGRPTPKQAVPPAETLRRWLRLPVGFAIRISYQPWERIWLMVAGQVVEDGGDFDAISCGADRLSPWTALARADGRKVGCGKSLSEPRWRAP